MAGRLPQQPVLRGLSGEIVNAVTWMWQELAKVVNRPFSPRLDFALSANTAITEDYTECRLVCTGTHTHTLPNPVNQNGNRYFFFNEGTGVITIAGTVKYQGASPGGDTAGYQLTNQYQFVLIEGDGTAYVVVGGN